MLLNAEGILDLMAEQLRSNPFAALCEGDYCPDCVDFKARIRAEQLAGLGASVSLLLPTMPESPDRFSEMIERFGYPACFGLHSDLSIVRLAPGEAIPEPPDNRKQWILQPAPQDLVKLKAPPTGYAGYAYAPLEAARAGMQPFYDVLYKAKCRDYVTDIFIEDGLTDLKGTLSPPLSYLDDLSEEGSIPLGRGHAQLREIVSAMRMRNFSGRYHLMVAAGNPYAHALRVLKEFHALIP